MKKVGLILCLLVFTSQVNATILFRNSATNITSGQLDPLRVSPDTFTMYGQNIPVSAISGAIPSSSLGGAIGSSQTTSGFTKMSVFDEGVAQGNINSINITGTGVNVIVSGTTATLNIPLVKVSSVVVGPPGMANVDYTIANEGDWRIMLGAIGLGGLTFSSTAQAIVYMREGNYTMTQATFPAGLTLIGVPSVSTGIVIHDQGTTATNFISVYGATIKNVSFNIGGLAFTRCPKIRIGSGTVMDNVEITGTQAMVSGTLHTAILATINGAMNVRLTHIKQRSVAAPAAAGVYGDDSPWRIHDSSDVIMQFDAWETISVAGVSSVNIGIIRSTAVVIQNSILNSVAGCFVYINWGSERCVVKNNSFYVNGLAANALAQIGLVAVADANGTSSPISSGTIVDSNIFYVPVDSGGGIVIKTGSTTANAARCHNLLISNNRLVHTVNANSDVFIDIDAGSYNTVILNNNASGIGTALSDNGTNTQKAGNFNNGAGF